MSDITANYRDWTIEVTIAITAKKGSEHFELTNQDIWAAALREGKHEIDEREGPEEWIEGYTNEALL